MEFIKLDKKIVFTALSGEMADLIKLLECSKVINTSECAGVALESIDQLIGMLATSASANGAYEILTGDFDDVFALLSAMSARSTDTERFVSVSQDRFTEILCRVEYIHAQRLVARFPENTL